MTVFFFFFFQVDLFTRTEHAIQVDMMQFFSKVVENFTIYKIFFWVQLLNEVWTYVTPNKQYTNMFPVQF